MTEPRTDLNGSVPDRSPVALILVDVINDLAFPGGEGMLEAALAAADRIADLKRRARRAGIPVVYANDNFGRWRSDFHQVVEHCLREEAPGRRVVERLRPDRSDYFVLKPKHSAFYASALELLLDHLEAEHLVLTGFSADICVLFTATDAYMRELRLSVPEDCVASASAEESSRVLAYMRRVLGADTTPSADLDLERLSR